MAIVKYPIVIYSVLTTNYTCRILEVLCGVHGKHTRFCYGMAYFIELEPITQVIYSRQTESRINHW